MSKLPIAIKILPIALIVAVVATRYVHGRYGNEVFICSDGTECELGSGLSWLLTGFTFAGPFIAAGGFLWSRRLHRRGRLGPFSHRAIPDSGQIIEMLMFLGAIAASYWLLLNGPSIEHVDIGRPNSWVEWLREFRAPDQMTSEDRQKLVEVPSRRTWFAVGTLLGTPVMLSFGSMLGREWYGRKRRKAQAAQNEDGVSGNEPRDHIDLTGNRSPDIDLTSIDVDTPTER